MTRAKPRFDDPTSLIWKTGNRYRTDMIFDPVIPGRPFFLRDSTPCFFQPLDCFSGIETNSHIQQGQSSFFRSGDIDSLRLQPFYCFQAIF